MERKKITILDLQAKKASRTPITMITAYDYPTALLADRADIDIILVGDSLAMVVLGLENTVSVTMDEMLHHCKAVARGSKHPLLVGDMPFMSYQIDKTDAIRNAARFLKEGGMDVVKLEGGREVAGIVEGIVNAGVPVMGHVGLTPQTISKLGGFRVQGKSAQAAKAVVEDAVALEHAGVFAIILEAVPDRLGEIVTERVQVPVIGIGAGPSCDGQVLVVHDMIGLFDSFTPKFVKRYANVFPTMVEALTQYRKEVLERTFPRPEHCYTMKDEVYDELIELLK